MRFLLFCFFVNISLATFANHYYISANGSDKNGGGIGAPWQTLLRATTAATHAGDVIHVMPGTYTENARCTVAPGVSIEGDDANKCIIQSNLTEQFVPILVLTSPEGTNGNQHISGLTLSGNKQKTSVAIEIRGRSNVSVYNCIIKDFDENGVIWSARNDNEDAPPNIFSTGNSFHHNVLANCAKFDGFGRGCLTLGGQQGMLIYDNDISQVGRATGTNGWPIKAVNDGYLKGCKIYNNKITKQAFDGISWDFAIELFYVSGLEIYNNTIVGAIDLNHQLKGDYPYSVNIHHNIIGPLALQPQMENGVILEFNTEDAIVTNNEFKNVGRVVFFTCRPNSSVTNVYIKNNTCTNIGVANGKKEGSGINVLGYENEGYYLQNLVIENNTFIGSENEKPYYGIQIVHAAKAKSIFIRNNKLQNFSATAITANPAWAIDSLVVENNTLNGNGYNNGAAFIRGNPQNFIFKNNKTANGNIFTVSNFTQNVIRPFYYDLKNTSLLEFIAVVTGILSVWFSRKENIYVYPLGLINTIIYIFLSIDGSLFGEASVNLYYTIMSIYGWILWSKRDKRQHRIVRVTNSTKKEVLLQFGFFALIYLCIFAALSLLKENFAPGAIPWADAFASATAFTGMWLMTKKKVESWYWWIATNIASIPLYFTKHFVLTSVYYAILLVMAYFGLKEWQKRARTTRRPH
jgi:nicotinamide mononucleotide transporter